MSGAPPSAGKARKRGGQRGAAKSKPSSGGGERYSRGLLENTNMPSHYHADPGEGIRLSAEQILIGSAVFLGVVVLLHIMKLF